MPTRQVSCLQQSYPPLPGRGAFPTAMGVGTLFSALTSAYFEGVHAVESPFRSFVP